MPLAHARTSLGKQVREPHVTLVVQLGAVHLGHQHLRSRELCSVLTVAYSSFPARRAARDSSAEELHPSQQLLADDQPEPQAAVDLDLGSERKAAARLGSCEEAWGRNVRSRPRSQWQVSACACRCLHANVVA